MEHPAIPGTGELVSYLKQVHNGAGWVDRMKIAYRPYICPFEELLDLVTPGDRVFDVGCGSGQFCLLLAHFAQPGWIGGIEVSERLISNARELFANSAVQVPHAFETFDGQTFPHSLGSADKVFLVDVLHHVPPQSQASFLAGLQAAMKPGAVLILKDIDAAGPLVYFNKLHDLVLSGEIGNELSAAQLTERAQQAGFTVKSRTHRRMWWYPHCTLVLEKL